MFSRTAQYRRRFVELPAPAPYELEHLTERIARRLTTLVERHTAGDARTSSLREETIHALREALSSSVVTPRLALDDEPPAPVSPLCARVAGLSSDCGRY